MPIRVCWNRRHSPKAAATTDVNGFSLMQFSFPSGERIDVMAKRSSTAECSMWQKVPMASTAYLTRVEIWYAQGDDVFIYAEPEQAIKEQLK